MAVYLQQSRPLLSSNNSSPVEIVALKIFKCSTYIIFLLVPRILPSMVLYIMVNFQPSTQNSNFKKKSLGLRNSQSKW